MELLAVTRRDGIGLLHFIWWRALTYAPTGDLSDFTDGQIARWADWDGDPGQLVSALKTAGFLDASRTLHDWDEYAGRWIDRRNADAARKRDARKAAAGRVNGVSPGTSGGHPAGRRPESGVPDLTGPDLTGPDRTEPPPIPQPLSPQAGQGERASTRRRGRGSEGEDTTTPPEVLVPANVEDYELWRHALGTLPPMTDHNREQLSLLEPLGRASDGGLRLRAPPGLGSLLSAYRGMVARALLDAGDTEAKRVVIVEA